MQSKNSSMVLGNRDTPSHKLFPDKAFRAWTLSRHITTRHSRSAPRKLIRATHPPHYKKQRESVESYFESTSRYFSKIHKEIFGIYEWPTHFSMRDKLHPYYSLYDQPKYSADWFKRATNESAPKALVKSRRPKDYNNRLELARSVGLSEVPNSSDASFDQLYGLFDRIMKFETEHDAVESLKRLRRE